MLDIFAFDFVLLERRLAVLRKIFSVGTLDEPARRSIVARNRQTERRFVWKIDLPLDKPLAERRLTDDQPAVPILDRARDDLACRGRPVVDEDDQGNVGEAPAGARIVFVEIR